MTYSQIIAKLSYLKSEGDIADYLIETDFIVKEALAYVKTRLTIFSPEGKPQVTTGLCQGKINDSDIQTLQEKSIEIAYSMNPIRELNELLC